MAQIPDALPAALDARRTVLDGAQRIRAAMPAPVHVEIREEWRRPIEGLPSAAALETAFKMLDADDADEPDVAFLRRTTLYGLLRFGYASLLLRERLRTVRNLAQERVGEIAFSWMAAQLGRYQIELRWIETLSPPRAAEWSIHWIRSFLWTQFKLSTCDPENLHLTACRGAYPGDADYITTITAGGDFPRPLAALAKVYDPRMWDQNPFAAHFKDVHPVTDVTGGTPENRAEAIGESWAEPSWISEHVTGAGTALVNTLNIQFAVTSVWIRLTYGFGMTVLSSSTLVLEQDFGFLTVDPVAGRPGWQRIRLEKNIRFSGTMGTGGGDIGWGDLANQMAPDLIARWLDDMSLMPCWTPP